MITITLPDGSKQEHDQAVSPKDVAQAISSRLAKAAVVAKVDGSLWDLNRPIDHDADVQLLTEKDDEALEVLRHTATHMMAQAVRRLYPDAKFTIGPVIKDGFFYDFDSPTQFSPDDLEKIEKEMAKIAKENHVIERSLLPSKDAIQYWSDQGNEYKVEVIEGIDDDNVSFYKQGEFTDLCEGPHVESTGKLKAFKLMSLAGAYWRGDEHNAKLQRIYGTAFFKQNDLDDHLKRLEEARQRDHRKLGKELGLFSFFEEGPGFPFYLPSGQTLFRTLEDLIRQENFRRGYQEIRTPVMLSEELWHKSGHYEHFREDMYFTDAGENLRLAVKPMSCPGACLVFGRETRSYRDLPIRLSELGYVHRMERGGVMHGILRVRAFTQDDAHVYCTLDQLTEEIQNIIRYSLDVYHVFGFDKVKTYVATRPENSQGSEEQWDQATQALKSALDASDMPFGIKEGEGAFYGPKIEFNVEDALERDWQLGTVQVDFSMPQRFELHYEGGDGERHTPVMIHKAVLGSLERFIGILIEHFAGKFPTWLAPVQVKILPVSQNHEDYARALYQKFVDAGIRTDADLRNEKLGFKIRHAQLEKVPYMLIVGDKERDADAVNIRSRDKGELGEMSTETFIRHVQDETRSRSLELAPWTS